MLLSEREVVFGSGFVGGLSIFSTFSLETVTMVERGNYLHAVGMFC